MNVAALWTCARKVEWWRGRTDAQSRCNPERYLRSGGKEHALQVPDGRRRTPVRVLGDLCHQNLSSRPGKGSGRGNSPVGPPVLAFLTRRAVHTPIPSLERITLMSARRPWAASCTSRSLLRHSCADATGFVSLRWRRDPICPMIPCRACARVRGSD